MSNCAPPVSAPVSNIPRVGFGNTSVGAEKAMMVEILVETRIFMSYANYESIASKIQTSVHRNLLHITPSHEKAWRLRLNCVGLNPVLFGIRVFVGSGLACVCVGFVVLSFSAGGKLEVVWECLSTRLILQRQPKRDMEEANSRGRIRLLFLAWTCCTYL